MLSLFCLFRQYARQSRVNTYLSRGSGMAAEFLGVPASQMPGLPEPLADQIAARAALVRYELDTARAETAALASALERRQAEAAALREELAGSQENITAARRKTRELDSALEAERQSKLSAEAKAQAAEARARRAQESTKIVQQQLKDARDELSEERSDRVSEVGRLRADLTAAETRLGAAEAGHVALKQQFEKQCAEIERIQSSIERERRNISAERLRAADDAVLRDQAVKSAEQRARAAESRTEELAAELQSAEQVQADMEADLESTRITADNLRQRVKEAEDRLEELFEETAPSDAGVLRSLRSKRGSLLDLYGNYEAAAREAERWKHRHNVIRAQMDEVLRELEERGPQIIEEREELERTSSELLVLRRQQTELQEKLTKEEWFRQSAEKRAADLEAERRSTNLTCRDLGLQVQCLVTNTELQARGQVPLTGSEVESEGQQIITERLLLFRSVGELQDQNERLLKAARALTDKLDEASSSSAVEPQLKVEDPTKGHPGSLEGEKKEDKDVLRISEKNDEEDEEDEEKDVKEELQQAVDEASHALESVQIRNRYLQAELDDARSQLAAQSGAAEERKRAAEMAAEISRSEHNTLRNQLTEQAAQLGKGVAELQNVRQQLTKAQSALSDSLENRRQLEVTVKVLERDESRLREQLTRVESEQERVRSEARRDIELAGEREQSERAQAARLLISNESLQSEVTALNRQLADRREQQLAEIHELREKTRPQEAMLEEVRKKAAEQLSDVQKSLAKVQDELAKANNELSKVKGELQHARGDAIKARLEATKQAKEVAEAVKRSDAIEQQLSKAQSEMADQAQTLAHAQAETQKFKAEASKATAAAEAAEAEIKRISKNGSHDAASDGVKQEISEPTADSKLEEHVDDKDDSLIAFLRREKEKVELQLHLKEKEIRELKARLDSLPERPASSSLPPEPEHPQIPQPSSAADALLETNKSLRNEISSLRQRFSELNQEMTENRKLLDEQSDVRTENRALTEQLKLVEEESRNWKQRVAASGDSTVDSKVVEELEDRLQKLREESQDKLNKSSQDRRRLRDELAKKEERIRFLENEVNKFEDQIVELTQQVEKFQKETKEIDSSRTSAESRATEAEKRVSELLAKTEELMKQAEPSGKPGLALATFTEEESPDIVQKCKDAEQALLSHGSSTDEIETFRKLIVERVRGFVQNKDAEIARLRAEIEKSQENAGKSAEQIEAKLKNAQEMKLKLFERQKQSLKEQNEKLVEQIRKLKGGVNDGSKLVTAPSGIMKVEPREQPQKSPQNNQPRQQNSGPSPKTTPGKQSRPQAQNAKRPGVNRVPFGKRPGAPGQQSSQKKRREDV